MEIQVKDSAGPPPVADRQGEAAGTVLAVGGFLAAFGVASCCALPIALSTLGLSAASLVGIGYLAGQYQQALFYLAAGCLAGAGYLAYRQWRARTCGSCVAGSTRGHLLVRWTGRGVILLAVGLLALTFWYEPPI